MIDISDIRMIKVVTEVGSINRAAEILHMSQPTLSKKISRLEHKISMELFIRNSSGMVPTEAAKILLNEGKDIETKLTNVERRLELMANLVGGQIRIGVGPIVEQLLVPKILLDVVENKYQFRISLSTDSPSALIEQLKTSQIDLAIGPFQAKEVADEFTPVLEMSEELVAVVRGGHPLANQSQVSFDELKKHSFIAPHLPRKMGNQILDFVKTAEIKPKISCDNYVLAKTIISNSDYITIGPASLFHSELKNGSLVKISFPTKIMWHCNCIVKPEILTTPAVKEVVSIFAQYMSTVDS
ncbi:LysR family transcriptional regulator [Aliikangiella coralliicola]|uniref:LysR family transcriptional regulator n=1 Tax=Aliikangiella coralliicola TaxID=2592383 RepID=A0A545UJ41_9GAMM|nr:LysR family transcriptional regulator [Aliikangiella coralliicola]TQV89480.1 LysR family transcriptional regulator [Aliikangiella coralliicola]